MLEDSQIIELFFARSEFAIKALNPKYGKVSYQSAYNILSDYLDTEECVNDVYLGTWKAILLQKQNPVLVFICRIVPKISIDRHRISRKLCAT